MNRLTGTDLIDVADLTALIEARDRDGWPKRGSRLIRASDRRD